MIFLAASAFGAGPFFTEPSAAEYWLPWQWHWMVSPLTEPTVQPWCVQTAVNALKLPSVGWVTTTFSLLEHRAAADGDVGRRADRAARRAASPGRCRR